VSRGYTQGMRRGLRAGIAAATAAVLAAAVTAGCGGGSSNALSLDPVAAAAAKTQQTGAARLRFSLALSSPQLQAGQTVRLQGAGAIDGTSGELTLRLGSLGGLSGIPSDASVKEIFLRQNGDFVVYIGLKSLAKHLRNGKQWIKLDVSKLGKWAGLDLGQLLSGSQLQPTDLLSMLQAEGATIRNVGSATIDGNVTTHYRVTIDPTKALQAKGLTSPLLAGMAAQLPTSLPVDVWIGKDGLVHRVSVSLGLAQSHVAMTMDLYDYGAPVTIAAPPSDTVYDATAFAQQGIGSGFH
jgi:hypothetical protein